MNKVAIFDYDGTIIQAMKSEDIDWHGDMVEAWTQFTEGAAKLPINEEVLRKMFTHITEGVAVVIVTARPNFLRDQFEKELAYRGMLPNLVFCRPDELVEQEYDESAKLEGEPIEKVLELVHDHHATYREHAYYAIKMIFEDVDIIAAYDDQLNNLVAFAKFGIPSFLVNPDGSITEVQYD